MIDTRPWAAVRDGVSQVVAVQHGCGADGAPVNCYIDEYRNWVCPNCMATYGAAYPLEVWGELRVKPEHDSSA